MLSFFLLKGRSAYRLRALIALLALVGSSQCLAQGGPGAALDEAQLFAIIDRVSIEFEGPPVLLKNPSVREAIQFTQEQQQAWEALQKEELEARMRIRSQARAGEIDSFADAFLVYKGQQAKKFAKVLDEKQRKRLLEISVQLIGPLVAMWPEAEPVLELRQEQIDEITQIRQRYIPIMGELITKRGTLEHRVSRAMERRNPKTGELAAPDPKNREEMAILTPQDLLAAQEELALNKQETIAARGRTADQLRKVLNSEQTKRFNQFVKKIKSFDLSTLHPDF